MVFVGRFTRILLRAVVSLHRRMLLATAKDLRCISRVHLRLLRYAFYPTATFKESLVYTRVGSVFRRSPTGIYLRHPSIPFFGLLMGKPSLVLVLGASLLLWLQSISLFAHARRFYELTLPSLSRNSFSSGVLFIDFSN